ncbi:MAG TPA: hypothetical protein DCW68_00750 [Rhodospirillaceae bacterium]|nr:MAG: permease [Alphaproteobacteria bacterium GWF2_58_20]HAU28628.1 hypothetical protein [Rhodospirillaceae bacterium]
MNWKDEGKKLALIVAVFLGVYFLPVGVPRFDNAVSEALQLVKWYAREHVLLCLVPAFFIAGAIGVFISQNSVMKYLGAKANRFVAYGVASASGTILAVCSCTVLPLFAGIWRMGAGLGPACAFLYSGPAINVLAIVLTAQVLGPKMGIARAVCAILIGIVIGVLMHFIFRKEDGEKAAGFENAAEDKPARPLWQNVLYFSAMIGILVFANWGKPQETMGFWAIMFAAKWWMTSFFAVLLGVVLVLWFGVRSWKIGVMALPVVLLAALFPEQPIIAFTVGALGLSLITSTNGGEAEDWFSASWAFAKQILPLLLFGVLVSGILLGRVGHEGLIPSPWISSMVGGNGVFANAFAAIVGAFMYFATLTEVPILSGLMANGMGQGPALTLLLAGPALSLPSMLVIRSVMGTKKTAVFISLVIVMSMLCGMVYGAFFA